MKGERPWGVDAKYDIALPCATQNEVGSPACNTWVMPALTADTEKGFFRQRHQDPRGRS